jgi:hypothetical protein
MPQHLFLPGPRRLPSRRAGGAGGSTPNRSRPQHGGHLKEQLSQVVRAPRRIDQGIDPDLVFKIRAGSRPTDSAFEGRGLQVLGESVDYTYFVLASDAGDELSLAIDHYVTTGDQRSFFNLIDDIEPYDSNDRRGPGIDEIDAFSDTVTVDVAIWPSGNHAEATRRSEVVEAVLARTSGSILLRSITPRRSYLRVQVTMDGLQDLMETSVVETIRTPPVPFLDFRDWRNLSVDNFTRIDQAGGVVGVLDDAPMTGHPMLDGLVLSVDALAPATYQWQRPGTHGTEVIGRLLFPRLHEALRDLQPLTAVGAVRVARILEPDPNPMPRSVS